MGLMKVLEFLDNSGTIIAKRIPEDDTEIEWGSQLTVRESQEAIFYRDGQALDYFTAGRYTIKTENIPLLTDVLAAIAYGGDIPFRAEVYFVSKNVFINLKWGTSEAVIFRDTEFKMIRLRAHGLFTAQVVDAKTFVSRIVGTRGTFSTEDIEEYTRGIICSQLASILSAQFKTILDVTASYGKINELMLEGLKNSFLLSGLQINEFYLNSITAPDEVQKLVDNRSEMAIAGNLEDYMKFRMTDAMVNATEQPDNKVAGRMSSGIGWGMGYMMPGAMRGMMGDAVNANSSKGGSVIDDMADKLKKLKELMDMGAITELEYNDKKKELLAKI